MRFLFSRRFEHFCAVYAARNLRRASHEAGVTQPALTKSIRSLEAHLGTPLFERTPQGMVPTAAADILADRFSNMERQARYAHLEIGRTLTASGPEIRVGAGLVWSWQRVPRIIGQLLSETPAVQVELRNGITEILLPQLYDGKLDIAVCDLQGVYVPAGFASEIIWKSPRRLWVREGHPLTALDNVTWDDLSAFAWAGYSTDRRLTSLLSRQFADQGLPSPQFRLQTSSLRTQLTVVRQSNLIGAFADEVASEAERIGLKVLPFESEEWALGAGFLYREEAERVPQFRRLLELLREG